MLFETEQKVVGASLHDPGLFIRNEFELDWVMVDDHKDIMQAIITLDGEFSDFGEVLATIKQFKPLTPLSESTLEKMSFKRFELNDYPSSVALLKKEFYRERVNRAIERYDTDRTKANYDTVKDRIREAEEADIPDKDGTLKEAYERLEERLRNGTEAGLSTYPTLDKILGGGIRGGKLITLGARPSVGKSAFALNIASQILINHPDAQIDFFTLEMDEDETYDRFISRFSDISSYKMLNPKTEMTDEQIKTALQHGDQLKNTGLRIYDSLFNIKHIEKQIRRRQHETEKGKYIAIVDYIGLIETDISHFGKQAEVSMITRTFKKLTNSLKIPIIMLSQLNRDIEKRQDKKPTLADLRESGSVEQDSNVVGFLYRDEEDDSTVNLNIAKNRGGVTFTWGYRFIGSKMYFEEMD